MFAASFVMNGKKSEQLTSCSSFLGRRGCYPVSRIVILLKKTIRTVLFFLDNSTMTRDVQGLNWQGQHEHKLSVCLHIFQDFEKTAIDSLLYAPCSPTSLVLLHFIPVKITT